MTAPMDELLPVNQHTATAWIVSASGAFQDMPLLASFGLDLERRGTEPPSPLPSWMPSAWAGHSSARALAALGLLESAAGDEFRMTLGGQMLSMRRLEEALA